MVAPLDQIRGNLDAARARQGANLDRINAGLPTDSAVEGTFLVDGPGEALQSVNFPIVFIARPTWTYGGELHIDTVPVAGKYPTISCVINRWITDPIAPTDYSKIYFVGANLLITTTGPPTQRMWVHWRASGRALVNPGPDTTTTTDSVV